MKQKLVKINISVKQNSVKQNKLAPKVCFLRKIYCLFDYESLNSCITENS